MGNKYGSNIRTYTARNLVWNCAAAQPVPFAMAAPANLTLDASGGATDSFLQGFYKAQIGATDWNNESRISIKRAGLFCNFADGLVQQMDASRISMTISAVLYSATTLGVGHTMKIWVGSNQITGPHLDVDVAAGDVVYDIVNGVPHFIQSAAAIAGGPAYITDYSLYPTTPDIGIIILSPVNIIDFTISNVATLNTMYETEIFMPYTKGANQQMLLSCQLAIQGGASYSFYTKSIDPLFNGSPVSFDSVIEVEVTPA